MPSTVLDQADSLSQTTVDTRQALVEAGIALFGEVGFDAASTREISTRAGANLAAITYHFGSKEGLRQACAEHVAAFLASTAANAFGAGGAGAGSDSGADPASLSRKQARRNLQAFLPKMVIVLLTEPRAEPVIRFMLREIAHPAASFDTVYASVIEPLHRRVCAYWARATGEEAESEAVRLAVFAVIGQALYFRIGEPIVTRRMGWQGYDRDQAGRIAEEITATLADALKRHRKAAKHAKAVKADKKRKVAAEIMPPKPARRRTWRPDRGKKS